MKTALAMVCRNFDVAAVGDLVEVQEVFQFAMMPLGLTVRFSMRG